MDTILMSTENTLTVNQWWNEYSEKHPQWMMHFQTPMTAIRIEHTDRHLALEVKREYPVGYAMTIRESNNNIIKASMCIIQGKSEARLCVMNKIRKDKIGLVQKAIEYYLRIMLYIANHQPDIKQSEYRPDCTKLSRKERRAIEREEYKNPVTYIFKTSKNGMTLTNQNQEKSHHASPSCSFNVRGHWRTYKTGRRIWVNEYTKGKGKPHKDKLYMLDNTNTIVLS
ncbi:hypothetical protein LJB89_02990 [Tyzzerella sp. OttesenSCG-928-J15]|nr:hypothetical protein [Tyzzerella sp. OttesenSCG-928-J15]MDL2288009.1 hypothetical protein [Oscillospiraceae bacterium OttesenSCG-928-F05]